MSGLVEATWLPLYAVTMPDGTVVEPGDTYLIPEGEANDSDNWAPPKGKRTKKTDDTAVTGEPVDEPAETGTVEGTD